MNIRYLKWKTNNLVDIHEEQWLMEFEFLRKSAFGNARICLNVATVKPSIRPFKNGRVRMVLNVQVKADLRFEVTRMGEKSDWLIILARVADQNASSRLNILE